MGRKAPPTAVNPRLQRVIQELFRTGATIRGGTAGAVRREVRTGELVGGKSHIRKAIERRRQLQHILRREELSLQDHATAQQLHDDLSDALREAGID
jgi:uridine phosphorylase